MKTLILILAMVPAWAGAVDAYNYSTGEYSNIEIGSQVGPTTNIEIYNYDTGEYKYQDVETVRRNGPTTEIEVYDYDSGEYSTYEVNR